MRDTRCETAWRAGAIPAPRQLPVLLEEPMRLGRSLAAAVGTAALVVAGALAGPAAADGPEFRSGNSDVTTSPSQPVTISGVGCTPRQGGQALLHRLALVHHERCPD